MLNAIGNKRERGLGEYADEENKIRTLKQKEGLKDWEDQKFVQPREREQVIRRKVKDGVECKSKGTEG